MINDWSIASSTSPMKCKDSLFSSSPIPYWYTLGWKNPRAWMQWWRLLSRVGHNLQSHFNKALCQYMEFRKFIHKLWLIDNSWSNQLVCTWFHCTYILFKVYDGQLPWLPRIAIIPWSIKVESKGILPLHQCFKATSHWTWISYVWFKCWGGCIRVSICMGTFTEGSHNCTLIILLNAPEVPRLVVTFHSLERTYADKMGKWMICSIITWGDMPWVSTHAPWTLSSLTFDIAYSRWVWLVPTPLCSLCYC